MKSTIFNINVERKLKSYIANVNILFGFYFIFKKMHTLLLRR